MLVTKMILFWMQFLALRGTRTKDEGEKMVGWNPSSLSFRVQDFNVSSVFVIYHENLSSLLVIDSLG